MIRNVVDGGDLLDRLAAADRLHGNLGLELGAAGAALQKRAMGGCQGKPDLLRCHNQAVAIFAGGINLMAKRCNKLRTPNQRPPLLIKPW
jgi:hypothetical protein